MPIRVRFRSLIGETLVVKGHEINDRKLSPTVSLAFLMITKYYADAPGPLIFSTTYQKIAHFFESD
jgi:hypothetical protein